MRVVQLIKRWIHRSSGEVSPQIRYPPQIEVLRRFLRKEDYDRILNSTPDRRMLLRVVAECRGVSEFELIREVGRDIGLPILDRIPAADFTVLPADMSVEALERKGATVLTEGGAISSVVCIDPAIGCEVQSSLGAPTLALAPWGEIARHLSESAQTLAEIKAIELRESLARLRETTEAVLGLIVQEVTERGYSQVSLDLRSEDPRYSIDESGTGVAVGALHAMLRPALIDVLKQDDIDVVLPSGIRHQVAIKPRIGFDEYTLTWECTPRANRSDDSHRSIAPISPPRAHGGESLKLCSGTVLVIDDNPDFGAVLNRFLERRGFRVVAFSSAEAAWSTLEEGTELDLIVCDVHMPGMSGYDFIRRLRSTVVGRSIPVVVLSSAEDVETEIRFVEAGVSAFISKAEDPRLLCAYIESLSRGEARLNGASR